MRLKKLVTMLVMIGIIMLSQKSFAASYTSNASPVTVQVSVAERSKNITFPFATRNLDIYNNDSNDAVFVDLNSDTNTSDTSACVLLVPGETINLYDFMTEGISILIDTAYVGGGNGVASPITVIATY